MHSSAFYTLPSAIPASREQEQRFPNLLLTNGDKNLNHMAMVLTQKNRSRRKARNLSNSSANLGGFCDRRIKRDTEVRRVYLRMWTDTVNTIALSICFF